MKTTGSTVIIDGKEYMLVPVECAPYLYDLAIRHKEYWQSNNSPTQYTLTTQTITTAYPYTLMANKTITTAYPSSKIIEFLNMFINASKDHQ